MKFINNSLFIFVKLTQKAPKIPVKEVETNLVDQILSILFRFGLFLMGFIVVLGLILYFLNFLAKHWDSLKNTIDQLKRNYFVIFLFFPIIYLIYYYAYFLPNKNKPDSYLFDPHAANYLLNASLTFLGTGVLTGSLKWFNNLAFFKTQFSEIIKSEDFSNVLSDKMKDLAMSDEYLLQRNDLEEIWKRVTLCKYEQKFPELGEEIQKKIENDLFVEQSLMYYYKNFRLQINLTLEGDIVKITEISSLTVISATTDKIEINFGTNSDFEDSDGTYSKLIEENCKCDGKLLKLETNNKLDEDGNANLKNTNFTAPLEGKKKYIIERQIEMTQDIKNDRVFSFSSSKIIEDLSINIKLDEKLDIFFSPVGKNIFNIDNHIRGDKSISYINRGLLLPGEKFKVFIYKKGDNPI